MSEVLLIRHAHTAAIGKYLAGRAPRVSLTEQGREQAARLAETLRDTRLAAVFTGPLERARDTALALAAPHRIEPVVRAEFDEVDYGAWTGLTMAALSERADWQQYHLARRNARVPGGELLVEVQARAMAGVHEIVAAAGSEAAVAIVSHADVIRCILASCLGMPLELVLRLEIAPAAVSRLRWQADGPLVLSVNEPGRSPGAAGPAS